MKLFTCDQCGSTFESTKSDEKAREEYEENFPFEAARGGKHAVVCDDCFNEIMNRLKEPTVYDQKEATDE